MKSLIILRGLDRKAKQDWVKREKLDNYFLNLDDVRKLYSMPDLLSPDKEFLGKSFNNTVRKMYLDILLTRLGKGCLVVVDTDDEIIDSILETLAIIYGYTTFYVVWDIPQDYLGKPKKYFPPYYAIPKRPDLEKRVSEYLNLQFTSKNIINEYSDVIDYWKEHGTYLKVSEKDKILHVSDLHSNQSLYKQLPKLKEFKVVIFHGDYVDGPEEGGSRYLLDLTKKNLGENIIWLEGNHELRVRKWLGLQLVKGDLHELILKSIPEVFLNTTAHEFNMDHDQALGYLQKMNENLKMFAILSDENNTFICTHAGLTYPQIIDPRYIGNVIYGGREMERLDKRFSDYTKKSNIWSIHAHCKYGDNNHQKYNKVINLDPKNENEIIYMIRQGTNIIKINIIR